MTRFSIAKISSEACTVIGRLSGRAVSVGMTTMAAGQTAVLPALPAVAKVILATDTGKGAEGVVAESVSMAIMDATFTLIAIRAVNTTAFEAFMALA